MDNLISKTQSMVILGIKSNSMFNDIVKKYNLSKIPVKNKAYYYKNEVIELHKEFEMRKKIRVNDWIHTST